jgi:hypothetical protein
MKARQFNFLIEAEKAEVFASLFCDETMVKRCLVGDGYSLTEKLLPVLLDMLAIEGLRLQDIAEYKVVSSLPEGYSTRRIAETIASVLSFAHTTMRR